VHSGAQHFSQTRSAQAGTDGKPSAQSLGRGDHIRFNPILFIAVKGPGPADAGLHLVDHQQDILSLAEGGGFPHELLFQRHDSALALNQFDQHGAGIFSNTGKQALKVVGPGVGKAFGEGPEMLMKHVLAGSRQGRHRSSMKGVHQRDDLCPLFAVFIGAVFSGQLNSAFIGLGSGIAEKHPAKACQAAQLGCQAGLHRGIVQVAHVLNRACLFSDRAHPAVVAVAQAVNADTAGKVNIFLSLGVHRDSSLSVNQRHGKPPVGRHQVFLLLPLDFLKIHAASSFLTVI